MSKKKYTKLVRFENLTKSDLEEMAVMYRDKEGYLPDLMEVINWAVENQYNKLKEDENELYNN